MRLLLCCFGGMEVNQNDAVKQRNKGMTKKKLERKKERTDTDITIVLDMTPYSWVTKVSGEPASSEFLNVCTLEPVQSTP